MGIVIDVIIAIICVTLVVKAYGAGFIRSVMNLVRGIISFLVSYAFTPMLGDILYKNWFLGWISGGIEKTIASISGSGEGLDRTYNLSKMFEEMQPDFKQIIDRYGANESEIGAMCNGVTEGSEETVSALSEYIAQPVADMVSSAVAFAAIFFGALIILSIVTAIVDGVFKLPVLKSANKLLGLLFGLGEAALFAVLLSSAAAAAIRGLGGVNPSMFGEQAVEGSVIMKFCSSVDLFGLLGGVINKY